MLWLILVTVIIVYITIKLYNSVNYWEQKGITSIKPWPLLGNFGETLLQRLTLFEQIEILYYKYPDAKFVGTYQMIKPMLMIRDPELIKQVTVKSFDSFMDHTFSISEDVDPLFSRILMSLKGDKWRNMRNILSPAFTSSKMRKMFILIKECAEQFTKHFAQKAKDKDILELEMKSFFTKYTNDVIASAAFGITCNSIENDKNEFYTIGQKFSSSSGSYKLLGFMVFPKLMRLLKLSVFEKYVTDFFRTIITSTIAVREKNNTIRPDMIHLLMEARKGKLKHELEKDEDTGFATVEESQIGKEETTTKPILTDDDIIAQALLFFLAGYETSSLMLSLLTHEIAVNPDAQKKLQDEIDSTLEKCNGNLEYDTLLKMKYLDMVVCESLRKWPPPQAERLCTAPVTLTDEQQSITLEKNDAVWIPVYCLHHDPKYFPNPEKFDPERFSDENKHNIQPFTYLPFGAGPRNCIGSRFALLVMKCIIVHLLSKFDIVTIDKTDIPLKLTKQMFQLNAVNGFWLGLKPRN